MIKMLVGFQLYFSTSRLLFFFNRPLYFLFHFIMPLIEDWTSDPHVYIQKIFDEGGDWRRNVSSFFRKQINDQKFCSRIPWLNETPLHNFAPNQVVRFRGMIQDMFDPEFYLDTYLVKKKNGETALKPGKYRDIAQCSADEELMLDSPQCETAERKTYYCISIPGENDWVKESYKSTVPSLEQPGTSYSRGHLKKRSLTEDDIIPEECKDSPDTEDNTFIKRITESDKRLKDSQTNQEEPLNSLPLSTNCSKLKFPLPGADGMACLVKVYSEVDFKLNEIVEVIGILSTDPSLAAHTDQPEDGFMPMIHSPEEIESHYPPPSLVPRLHALCCQSKLHCNPYMPSIVTPGDIPDSSIMRESRELLRSILEEALMGDGLAAEYLTCHLISSVYLRQDIMPLGNFGLNISGIGDELLKSNYTNQLYNLLQSFTTHSFLFPITLDGMNKLTFVPKKDYQSNRLQTGILQLPPHFQLLLDETQLSSGQLDQDGLRNLTSLGNMINWQRVDYDFQYHTLEQHTNVNALVLSEGKAMISCPCRIHLDPVHTDVSLAFSKVSERLNHAVLRQLRIYLTASKLSPYTLSDTMQKRVQEDFVDSRKNDNGMSADDLHSLLIVGRLLSLSCGEQELTSDVWKSAKILESERKGRIDRNRTEQN